MSWLSIDETFTEGHKLRALYKALGCSAFEALGIAIYLKMWGLHNADEDGTLLCTDAEDIKRYLIGKGAGNNLDSDKIVGALLESKILDKNGDDFILSGWGDEQKYWNKYNKTKITNAESKRAARVRSKLVELVEEISKPNHDRDKAKQDINGVLEKINALEDASRYYNGDIVEKKTILENYLNGIMPEAAQENKKTEKPAESTETKGDTQKERKNAYNKDFEEIWSIYPRKVEKQYAYKAYNARLKDGWSPDELKTAVQNYANVCRKEKTEETYIKHMATFLSASTPFSDYIPKEKPFSDDNDSGEPDMSNPFGKYLG